MDIYNEVISQELRCAKRQLWPIPRHHFELQMTTFRNGCSPMPFELGYFTQAPGVLAALPDRHPAHCILETRRGNKRIHSQRFEACECLGNGR